MKSSNVRYCYAFDENDQLVFIDKANSMEGHFYCPHCKDEMIKRCGQHNAWHFAHKKKQCSYDKYLHTLAELRIQKWFNGSEKVEIELSPNRKCPEYDTCKWRIDADFCCRNKQTVRYNLKNYYCNAELEKTFVKDGNKYVADIFCHNQKNELDPLFIEINVTHRCEPEKINSKIRIVEIDFKSETDIDNIIGQAVFNEKNARFYNFKPKEGYGDRVSFNNRLTKFIFYPSPRKPRCDYYLTCQDVNKRRGVFELTIRNDGSFSKTKYGFYDVAMAVASKYLDFRSCFLCKYQSKNSMNFSICCLYKKYGTHMSCSENNPNTCSFYCRDKKKILNYCKVFEDYSKEWPVDIWINDNESY